MALKDFGISMEIPRNALPAGQSELIKLSVMTDLTQYVALRDDELLPAFGIQCLPHGLKVNVPITVRIPHCAKITSPDNVIPVLYSGKTERGGYLLQLLMYSQSKVY